MNVPLLPVPDLPKELEELRQYLQRLHDALKAVAAAVPPPTQQGQ